MTAVAETETADIIAAAYSGIGNKGYQGSDFNIPFKKLQGGELLDAKGIQHQVNKLRAPVERAIAHLKRWRILHTDYRGHGPGPSATRTPAVERRPDDS